jgi:taurine dioxygenase
MRSMALTSSGFGEEIAGLDLSSLDEGARSLLRDRFHASGGLLMIRGQRGLSPEAFRSFAAIFGELESNDKYDPAFLLPGFPEILRLGNLKENGRYRSLFIEADPPPLLWHSDDTFRHPQPLGSCLLSVVAPSSGGETGFAGMAAAYDALSGEMKKRIEGLVALHSYEFLNELLRKRNPHRPPLSEELRREFPPLRRPLVATHPVTGRKSLYIPKCHVASIDGFSSGETEELLSELLAHATGEEFAYMHRWEEGDVVVWDNRSTLHAPTPFDGDRHQRLLYRITVEGAQIQGF